MKIESVDLFYLSMPEIMDIGDGSQDALLVRVRAGGLEGWGECEAAPLPSIAAYVCPLSHSACHPVQDSVVGQRVETPEDILRINRLVREKGFDLLQTAHTLSGIDIALWDLLGQKRGEPVYRLLGYKKSFPKLPYASQLFADSPQQTLVAAKQVRAQGYRAAKFGWGPFGRGSLKEDLDQIYACREGLGRDGILLIDAGTVWLDDVKQAKARLKTLKECETTWLEEPFVSGALQSYRDLSRLSGKIKLAGGEGCHDFYMAKQMIDYAGIRYVQIDSGRIGGISTAKQVADYARRKKVTFVNHTFTTHLALSASLQPYAGIKQDVLAEYPVSPKSLAAELTTERILPDRNGEICLPEEPGLGLMPNPETIRRYLVDVEIKVKSKLLYQTPPV